MKIGLLTTGFPRFEGDCSGSFLLSLARGVVEHGHEVRVLAPEPRRDRPVPRWPGIEVSWVPYARPRPLQQTFYGSGAPDNLRLKPQGKNLILERYGSLTAPVLLPNSEGGGLWRTRAMSPQSREF